MARIRGPYSSLMVSYKGKTIHFKNYMTDVTEEVAAFLCTRPGYSLVKQEEKLVSSTPLLPIIYVPLLKALPLKDPAVRMIAYYLPQFHTIPENDLWWGKGFTEWTNVQPAQPLFEGHYQPHIPGELDYYNLLDSSVMKRQIELAKLYGLGGFCFYFYWFNGKRLLEQPLLNLLEDKALEFPFCICWANENWTKKWDGQSKEVLLVQRHSPEDDLVFIQYVSKYLRDSRYIRIDGKPVLLVYRPYHLPDGMETTNRWRKWCRENDIGEIYLICNQSREIHPPSWWGFDAAGEFLPGEAPVFPAYRPKPLTDIKETRIYDWTDYAKNVDLRKPYKFFKSCFPSWDNTPRCKNRGAVFVNNTPELYEKWLCNLIRYTQEQFKNKEEQLLFVNAWNEWAEGTHLEPDRKYGYAWLQATRNALQGFKSKKPELIIVKKEDLPTEFTDKKKRILFDLLFCQNGYHGGGEYGKVVFKSLSEKISSKDDCEIYVALNRDLSINEWIYDICLINEIKIIDIKSYDEIAEIVNRDIFDVFFAPAIVVYTAGYMYMKTAGKELPFNQKRTKVIGTLHDIRDYELALSKDTEESLSRLKKMYANIVNSKHIDTLITDSEYSKKSILDKISDQRNIKLFYPPMKERSNPNKGALKVPIKFALLLGGHRSEKNISSAITAFEELFAEDVKELRGFSVVITGVLNTNEFIIKHKDRFTLLGYVSPEELEYLYSQAFMLVYPSLSEGFGYPPLEIMKYNKSSVVSNVTSLPEIYKDSAVFCTPSSVASIRYAIYRLIKCPINSNILKKQYDKITAKQKNDLDSLINLILNRVNL